MRWIKPTPLPTKPVELAFREALATPIMAKPFEREKCWSPAIIFSDFTRKHSPFISQLINMIEPKTDDIKIICAGGTHIPSEADFIKKVVGEDIYKRYQKNIRVSSVKNPASKYEWIGVTSRGTPVELNKELFDRDLLISTLNVQPHYFAGYEGGAKALLPGCSGLKTISPCCHGCRRTRRNEPVPGPQGRNLRRGPRESLTPAQVHGNVACLA